MTKNPWDLIAKKYDEQFGDKGDYAHRYMIYPALLNELANVKNKQILDIGCGTGTLVKMLSNLGAVVTGIDSSKEMISLAKSKNGSENHYELLDAREKLPYSGGSFDTVLQIMLLHTIEDDSIKSLVDETKRILKKGGECVVVIPHPCFVTEFRSVQKPATPMYLSNFQTSFYWIQFDEMCQAPTLFNLRPIQFYINLFCQSGLFVTKIIEPSIINSKEAWEYKPHNFKRRREIPSFMMIKLVKLQ